MNARLTTTEDGGALTGSPWTDTRGFDAVGFYVLPCDLPESSIRVLASDDPNGANAVPLVGAFVGVANGLLGAYVEDSAGYRFLCLAADRPVEAISVVKFPVGGGAPCVDTIVPGARLVIEGGRKRKKRRKRRR